MWKHYLNIAVLCITVLGTLWGCGSGGNNHTNSNAGPAEGFVVTTDFSVGNLSTLTTTTPRTATKNVLGSTGVHPDSVIRAFSNRIFIIQRLGANSVLVIDPNHPSTPLANYTTNDPGPNAPESNPVDIEFVSLSKAYISRYELNTILIVNPLTGEQLGTIDLSQFVDSDGIVEMDQMVIVNGKLYVTLQRLNRNDFFSASNDSYVVVMDTSTDQIVDVDPGTPGTQPIVLQGRNPASDLIYLSSTNRIYVANTGTFFTTFSTSDGLGGIEVVNPDSNATEGIIISDDILDGGVGTIAILNATVAYVVTFDPSFNNIVKPFNPSTLEVSSPLTGMGTTFISGLAFDGNGFLYVADHDITNPGIQVFDSSTNVKIEGPIDTGLPPAELIFVTP